MFFLTRKMTDRNKNLLNFDNRQISTLGMCDNSKHLWKYQFGASKIQYMCKYQLNLPTHIGNVG